MAHVQGWVGRSCMLATSPPKMMIWGLMSLDVGLTYQSTQHQGPCYNTSNQPVSFEVITMRLLSHQLPSKQNSSRQGGSQEGGGKKWGRGRQRKVIKHNYIDLHTTRRRKKKTKAPLHFHTHTSDLYLCLHTYNQYPPPSPIPDGGGGGEGSMGEVRGNEDNQT